MIAIEAKNRFLIELEAASNAAPGFTDNEISEFFKISEKNIIDSLILNKDYASLYTILEEVKITPVVSTAYSPTAAYNVTLPNDFYSYVRSSLKISERVYPAINKTSINETSRCIELSMKDFDRFINSRFGTDDNYFKYPIIMLGTAGDALLIVDDYCTINDLTNVLSFSYVRVPESIDIGTSVFSELPVILHSKIVTDAVKEAVKSTFATKYNQ